MKWLPIVALLVPGPSHAAGFSWPADEASITCRMVRVALRIYSRDALESMARARGVSEATIAKLKRC